MTTNKISLPVVLVVCACLALFLSSPTLAKPTVVVRILPVTFQDREQIVTRSIGVRTLDVLTRRLDREGSGTVSASFHAPDLIFIELPDNLDAKVVEEAISRQGRLELKEPETELPPEDSSQIWRTRLDGSVIAGASATINEQIGAWNIEVELTDQGSKEFAALTREMLGKPLGIFFDEKLLSAPIIQTPITGGRCVITGNFSEEDARLLADQLNSGALPARLKIESTDP